MISVLTFFSVFTVLIICSRVETCFSWRSSSPRPLGLQFSSSLVNEPLIFPFGGAFVEGNHRVFFGFVYLDTDASDGIAVIRGREWSNTEEVAEEVKMGKNSKEGFA